MPEYSSDIAVFNFLLSPYTRNNVTGVTQKADYGKTDSKSQQHSLRISTENIAQISTPDKPYFHG